MALLRERTAARPVLKWAGGKGRLLDQFEEMFPAALRAGRLRRYVEPFIGGGAVFFHIAQQYSLREAVLCDVNPELILAYKVLQRDPELLIEELDALERPYLKLPGSRRKSFYYEIRDSYNASPASHANGYDPLWAHRAARMIFLNKTCFNGLYRVNRSGHFNVPHGRYACPCICDQDNLRAASALTAGSIFTVRGSGGGWVVEADRMTSGAADPELTPQGSTEGWEAFHWRPYG